MAYVTVPKDLTNVKTKILFNLTKRQLICFGSGAIVGIPVFFLLKNIMNTSSTAICMILVMLPFFMFAMYEKNGQPLEKIVGNIVKMYFVRPKQRPYRTKNYYTMLSRQQKHNREVKRIVAKTDSKSTKANRSGGESREEPR